MRHRMLWLAAAISLAAPSHAQRPWQARNLQHFPKDISREALVQEMRQFSFALGVRCEYCHSDAIVTPSGPMNFALRAFDIHAIDYLLKPFPAERFRTALARARERLRARDRAGESAALAALLRDRRSHRTRIPVRSAGRTRLLDVSAIDWLEAADNYVRLRVGAREYLLRQPLSSLERQLDPRRFVRIHRSVIVQADRVASMRPASHGDYDLWLRDGTRLTLSRTWRPHARSTLHR